MKRSRWLLLTLVLVAAQAVAAPVAGPPVNQGSFIPPGFRQYGIAQGSMFAVFGVEIGPATTVSVFAFPLPTELAGTSVQVTVNGVMVDCFMVFTSAGQLAAILPSNTPIGDGEMRVIFNGEASEPQPIRVVASAAGMFTISQNGQGRGVFTTPEFAVNSYLDSFAPNDVAIAWVTGLGARTVDDRAGPEDLKDRLEIVVTVGGIPVQVLYAGPSGCCSGVDQVVFEIPEGRFGCHVPVAIRIGDSVSNFATMSIAEDGAVCGDVHGLSAEEVALMHQQGSVTVGQVVLTKAFSSAGPELPAISQQGPAQALQVSSDLGFTTGRTFARMSLLEATPDNYYKDGPFADGTCGVTLNVVTRRGTNEWRGSGRFIVQNGDSSFDPVMLDEPDYFNEVEHPSGLEAIGAFSVRNEAGASVNGATIDSEEEFSTVVDGPIIRDKLWIWAQYGQNELDLLTQGADGFTLGAERDSLTQFAEQLRANLDSSPTSFYTFQRVDEVRTPTGLFEQSIRCYNAPPGAEIGSWGSPATRINTSRFLHEVFDNPPKQDGAGWGLDKVFLNSSAAIVRDSIAAADQFNVLLTGVELGNDSQFIAEINIAANPAALTYAYSTNLPNPSVLELLTGDSFDESEIVASIDLPAELTFTDTIFSDGFESGDVAAWVESSTRGKGRVRMRSGDSNVQPIGGQVMGTP